MDLLKRFLDNLTQLLGGRRSIAQIIKSFDLVLAFFMVIIIMLMVIPVPPVMIDMLISINLTAGISLLMVAIYIPSAIHLSIFPSLLLITTLFRLGVNISSTRQILLHAFAGDIIQTFGNFVVGGSFVVGGVIFLIITMVQFIVITKGAERVAEVAARFRLDAMPGKQMSIDADMRAGILDANQARLKRLEIQKESELYGAMDGAMKFVKGDAIAGIVITLINIVGGLIIGSALHGMTLLDSAKTYTLLSIGDGLVSQVPALLISITAGIVTTKVSSDNQDSNLGKELAQQIFKQPKALLISSGVLLAMSLIPGFPPIPFIVLSAIIGSIGYVLLSTTSAGKSGSKGLSSKDADLTSTLPTGIQDHSIVAGATDEYALTIPIILELGGMISKHLEQSKMGKTFIDQMIPLMRQALYQDTGVRFPGVHVRTNKVGLDNDEYSFLLNEVPIINGKVLAEHLLTNENEKNLKRFNIAYKSYQNSLNLPSLWVEYKYREILKKAGIKFWDSLEVVILHLSYFFRRYANEFVGIQEVKGMIEFLEKSYPDLVKEVTRLVPLQRLTEIFKRLIQEQISIKDLRGIFEALSEWAQTEKDTVLLTEYIRSSLKRYISFKYSQGQSTIAVYLLDPEIEDMIRGGIKQTSSGSYIALDPDSVQLIVQAMRNTIPLTPPGGQPPVLLTAIDVRRFARKLIEMEFPDVSVISYQEVIPEIRIQPLGRVQIS